MYMSNFPDGTIAARDLPADIYLELMKNVAADGTLYPSIGPVHGNYVNFATYKVRVTIYEVTDSTYKVRLT